MDAPTPEDLTHEAHQLERTAAVTLHNRLVAAEAERDKLAAFKSWVHGYLDAHGVPHHPPGTHGAAGCRIGDRMDWLMGQMGMETRIALDYQRQRDAALARVRVLEAALRRIQEWDCLNPPDAELCCDHPWLKRLVDDALAPAPEK